MRSYRKLMQISLLHTYYPNGNLASKDLLIIPTPKTREIIRNYRLILKNKESKIEIIQECEKDSTGIEAVVKIDSQLLLEFIVGQGNKQFFSFTGTRFLKMRQEIFYFSNKQNGKISQKGALTVKKSVTDDDIVAIKELNLEQNQSSSGIIGVIKLYADTFLNEAVQTENPFKYQISFAEKQTFWQYNIIKKYNSFKNLKIIDEEKQVTFTEVKDNSADLKFISDKKLPLKVINNKVLKLISSDGKTKFTKTHYEKLPCPSIRDIAKHHKLQNEYIAVVNVYI